MSRLSAPKRKDEMRAICYVVFTANVLLMVVSLAILPDQVAIHFGRGGAPDSWASKEVNVLAAVYFSPAFLGYRECNERFIHELDSERQFRSICARAEERAL